MKKIEPVAYMTYKGYLLHASDPKVAEHDSPEPLYTREALEAAVEAMKQECIERATAWQDKYVVVDNAYQRIGQDIDESVDTDAIINQLTGE